MQRSRTMGGNIMSKKRCKKCRKRLRPIGRKIGFDGRPENVYGCTNPRCDDYVEHVEERVISDYDDGKRYEGDAEDEITYEPDDGEYV